MLKEESNGGGGGGCAAVINNWARVCDTCRAAACTVYCKADLAYLCASCDARVHAANRVASRHERVWVCEGCERAPAAVLCKADAASLCPSCDADIHSVNPLALRHLRVPILPVSGCLYGPPIVLGGAGGETTDDMIMTQDGEDGVGEEDDDEEEAASWLLINPVKDSGNNQNHNCNNGFSFGSEVAEYLDLFEHNSNSCVENQYSDNQHQRYNTSLHQNSTAWGGDRVVPVQCGDNASENRIRQEYHDFHLDLELESSKAAYSYNDSICHSVSISSKEVGVVPDDSRMSNVLISHSRPAKGTIDLFIAAAPPSIQMASQLSPMEREARVLRYREKKKTRKFKKTIRYASRKAYAETRPRIKGRFVKRSRVEVEVDQMLNLTLMAETGYGVVPSF